MKAERLGGTKQERSASVSVNAGFSARWVELLKRGFFV
jgi:hypothetical protein